MVFRLGDGLRIILLLMVARMCQFMDVSGGGYVFDTGQRIGKGFAVQTAEGEIFSWGGGDVTTPTAEIAQTASPSGYNILYSTENAFLALDGSGIGTTWGVGAAGGNSTSVTSYLQSGGVARVHSTKTAFLALKTDGVTLMWGANKDETNADFSSHVGLHMSNTSWWREEGQYSMQPGGNFSARLDRVFTNRYAFAGLTYGGRLVTFGDSVLGGSGPDGGKGVDMGIRTIGATLDAFCAVTYSGDLMVWGAEENGGDLSSPVDVSFDVRQAANVFVDVVSTSNAFAALTELGRVFTWGAIATGGNSVNVNTRIRRYVTKVFSNYNAFVVLKSLEEDPLVMWGVPTYGGSADEIIMANLTDISNPVVNIYSSRQSFCALRRDGSVIPWGNPGFGGDFNIPGFSDETMVGVERVVPNPYAFVVMHADGSVQSWGHMERGANLSYSFGTCGDVTFLGSKLLFDRIYISQNCPIVDVIAGERAFTFITDTGGVIVTGDPLAGADLSPFFVFDPARDEGLGQAMALAPLGERPVAHMNFSSLTTGAASGYGSGSTNVMPHLASTSFPTSMPSGQPTSLPTVAPPPDHWLIVFWESMNAATQFMLCLFAALCSTVVGFWAWGRLKQLRGFRKTSVLNNRLQGLTPTARASMMVSPGPFGFGSGHSGLVTTGRGSVSEGPSNGIMDRFGGKDQFLSPADQARVSEDVAEEDERGRGGGRRASRIPDKIRRTLDMTP